MALSEAVVEGLGGAVGACIAYGVTYPLTTVSTWQALQQRQEGESQHDTRQSVAKLTKYLPSPVQDLISASQTKGWAALFAGVQPTIVANFISQGLYFYLYSAIRSSIVAAQASRAAALQGKAASSSPARTQDIGVVGSLIVASLAGSVNTAVTHPIWLIAMKQQAASRKGRASPEAQENALQIARKVYQQEGVKGLWKGLTAALVMVINPTVQYIIYEWLSARLLDVRRKQASKQGLRSANIKLSASDAFLMSALGKIGATLVTYPMLVVKNRMQASSRTAAEGERYEGGVVDTLTRIIRSEGWEGLFQGMKAKMFQTVLSAALLMAIKEQVYNTIRAAAQAAARRKAQLVVA